jgi:4a-hydroxytetrahydrobiopterin dehydratase
MARPHRLQEKEIKGKLGSLPGWSYDGGRLHKEFQFDNFTEAFRFMTRVAPVAESMNHHPDWSNAYNKVVVDLATHDAGGVTELDISMAEQMEEAAGEKPR